MLEHCLKLHTSIAKGAVYYRCIAESNHEKRKTNSFYKPLKSRFQDILFISLYRIFLIHDIIIDFRNRGIWLYCLIDTNKPTTENYIQ